MMLRDAKQIRKGPAKQMKRNTYGGTEQNKFTRLHLIDRRTLIYDFRAP